jgi:UDP-3-O-[3-hydroxymyristoyl] N-acetylglucosamine deacetylase/UDP-3-O-[3-hydroxymyristoyl] N-acetylglucosamine deacetylase/3-hydroxyacyl-[acyl-carrier-protein] dehydratase
MLLRSQHTLRQSVETQGVGLFTGSDVRLRFLPAPADHGIAFQRTDVVGSSPIPARIEFVTSSLRRTTIARDGVQVEMIEHVMAALAGLQIDNCLIELNGPEVPGFDGSCLDVCRLLIEAGCVEQDRLREVLSLRMPVQVSADESEVEVSARPMNHCGLAITYQLDYGDRSPIPPQNLTSEITPETFVRDIAFARTFVLESEVAMLRAAGYGRRMTCQDLLVFDASGNVIENELRTPDEPVRHKILDCLGDFALIGSDLRGYFNAYRSGHRHNHDIVRHILLTHQNAACSEAV